MAAQKRQPASLFNWMKRLIQLRKSTSVFSRGTIAFLKPANHRVLAYVRAHGSDQVLVVNNLSSTAQAVELDLAGLQGRHPHRDVRRQPLPSHRRATVRADAGAIRLLLVPAALALGHGR